MANKQHLKVLRQGRDAWNRWRAEHPRIRANLSYAHLVEANLIGANLSRADLLGAGLSYAHLTGANLSGATLTGATLYGADLTGANLSGANLSYAHLVGADLVSADLSGADLLETDLLGAQLGLAHLTGANLSGARLSKATLFQANLSGATLSGATLSEADLSEANLGCYTANGIDHCANLSGANLSRANLSRANLSGANLSGADLSRTMLIETNLSEASLTGCRIYGISAWDVRLDKVKQTNLVITPEDQPTITVDNLKIAQFIYLLLNNEEIRDAIDTITSKVVLILGRFTPERKIVLDALREELRHRDYLPIVFDFDIPKNRDITETVSLLARMSRFVIADLTEARSIPQELSTIIPDLPSVPVQPILLATEREYSMFEHFKRYPWMLQDYLYTSIEGLLAALKTSVIDPAEQKAAALRRQP